MKREFELKAALEDDGSELRRRLSDAGWHLAYEGEMRDRRYDTRDRALERRDEVLRLRRMTGSGEGRVVLCWKGPASEEGGYKVRDEIETEVGDAEAAERVLQRLGYTEITLAVDRQIVLYEKEGVQARIEFFPAMDTLVEVEGAPELVEALLGELGLPRDVWKPWPLDEFVRRYEGRTSTRARLSREASIG